MWLLAEQLDRPIVKAWNSIGSDSLAKFGRTSGDPNLIALSVAGDRETHRKIGMQLVNDLGFDAYDAGPLADSWRQQPGAPAYCTDLTIAELPSALSKAEKERLPKTRDLAVSVMMEKIGKARQTHLQILVSGLFVFCIFEFCKSKH